MLAELSEYHSLCQGKTQLEALVASIPCRCKAPDPDNVAPSDDGTGDQRIAHRAALTKLAVVYGPIEGISITLNAVLFLILPLRPSRFGSDPIPHVKVRLGLTHSPRAIPPHPNSSHFPLTSHPHPYPPPVQILVLWAIGIVFETLLPELLLPTANKVRCIGIISSAPPPRPASHLTSSSRHLNSPHALSVLPRS